MDHVALARELLAAPAVGPGFVQPHYTGRGIANLGPSLLRAFGVDDPRPGFDAAVFPPALLDGVRRVVCLVVDALGYQQLLREIERQPELFLGQLIREGTASFAPVTSVFPSTTVNALTTMNTGALPAEHGILGYTLYLQELGAVAEMIRFGPFAGPWTFAEAGVDPVAFLGIPTLFTRLRERAGVTSYMINYAGYRGTSLTTMHATDAEYVPYLSFSDLAVHLRQLLERPDTGPVLISAYYGVLDGLCHVYGALSPEHSAEVAAIDLLLRRELFERVRQPETLFILLADHGHINCVPERSIDLVEHRELMHLLVAAPTGEGRARYLHVRNGQKEAVRDYVATHFGAIATLLGSEEALARGLFGPAEPSLVTRERIGDFVLLPHENWYFHHYPTERLKPLVTIGRHGGLTPDEMLSPLLALRLG